MSAPNIAGTWYTRANCQYPDTSTTKNVNDGWAFMLKELLKGTSLSGTEGPVSRPASTFWTVEGSCDGTTAAMDGVDRLTGSVADSYDASKWVHAASGSAHSWIVLKSPDALGPVYMCIDANSTTTTTYGVIFSRQAFVISGNGVVARPITNNAWAAGTTADPIQTTNVAVTTDQVAGAFYRAHVSVDASGAFNFATSRDGTGIFHSIVCCFNTTDRNANDTSYPTFCLFHAVATGRGAPAWSTVGTSANNCNGRTVDGTSPQTVGGFSNWAFGASTSNFAGAATPDLGYTNIRFLPIYIQTMVASKNSWRGRMPDVWIVGNAPVGYAYPNVTNPTQHVVGDIIIPLSVRPII